MRRRKNKLLSNDDASVDMTPMLDIVFIMLIFFIVTTSFVKESGFIIDKPKSAKATTKAVNISIHIDQHNIIHFNNRPVDIELLSAQIEFFLAENATKNVLFRPHENTTYQSVVNVLDKIKPFKNLKISIGTYKP
ncbi:MAG: biopolymer transporter ExbD [Alteromonadaceae bacterium]|nr:biopolymer transporter ExbD [Alteromonadaceae bacterium]